VETGVTFFAAGLGGFADVPSIVRPFVFRVCARQMILSATTAAEAFREAPALAVTVNNPKTLRELYEVAGSIARRSAKHSAAFLNATAQVLAALGPSQALVDTAVDLVKAFAEHAGGIAADAWISLPAAIERLDAER